jgi:SecD/SecF fusion protein
MPTTQISTSTNNYANIPTITKIDSLMNNSIISCPPVLGAIIALALMILAIGILVSILYRIPGTFIINSIMAIFSVVFMSFLFSGYVFTVATLIGLFIGLIVSTFSIINICERIKKHLYTHHTLNQSLTKSIKKGIFQVFDLHFVVMMVGVLFAYLGSSDLIPFGFTLILYSFISLVLIGLT